ncbi:NYN domain-containing protein [Actinoalloteichus spitiensis]|uniref:NYN domain-containing protein n=1 Tax=Actinoalloteichus spitiensis TaxID=252394 RepID=UPI000584A49C|nr:NYN domain-containing protein [Actinoalloteichus spitiensis]
MRSQCAVYVDAGYLLAASATRITGTSLLGSIEVDHEQLVEALIAHATEHSGLPLLRVHWYDAARHKVPDPRQEKIGLLPHVKLRLGRIGFDGEQKGVDLRIGLDLVAHARKAAVDAIYLVSGDDDLTEAVEEAQAHGVRVTVLAVPNRDDKPHGVSRHLQSAADGLDLISSAVIDRTITPRSARAKPAEQVPAARPPVPSPAVFATRAPAAVTATARPVPPSTRAQNGGRSDVRLVCSSSTDADTMVAPGLWADEEITEKIDQVVDKVLRAWWDGDDVGRGSELAASRPSIPKEVDRALLLDLSDALGIEDLADSVRFRLRARFWERVDAGGPDGPG